MTVPPMRVETHIPGSYCVVYPTNNAELYIDCRKDPRGRDVTHIDVMRGLRHLEAVTVFNNKAPETIIRIALELRK